MSGFDMFAKGAWDDRDMVKGWNRQVKEYRVYHSVQRKNQKTALSERLTPKEIFDLSDLADPEELEEMGISLEAQAQAHAVADAADEELQDADMEIVVDDDDDDDAAPSDETDDPAARQLMQEAEGQQHGAAPHAPAMPGTALAAAPGAEDALKNMQWAWYYAGYYQGQYEAQLRSTAQQSG